MFKLITSFNQNNNFLWEVGELFYDFDKSCEETILKTFSNEKNAIKYIVDLYINNLLEDNNFSNTKSKYYYRKKCKDMYSEWIRYTIRELELYININKVNNEQAIKKYFYDYNIYIAKIRRKNLRHISLV